MKILPVNVKKMAESGNPFFIEIYNIYLKTGIVRICNADVIINFDGNEYHPVPIERGSIKSSVDEKLDNVDLKISDVDNSKVSALMEGFDFRGKKIEIFKIQYPDSLTHPEYIVPTFFGYIDAPSYSNGEFTCIVVNSFPKSKNPFRTTQYFCNHTFGDEQCKASKKELSLQFSSSGEQNKINIIGFNLIDDKYENGIITIGYETKMIKSQKGNIITTYYPFQGDLNSYKICKIERNCDKTPETCNKYNNRENYGGFIALPYEFRVLS